MTRLCSVFNKHEILEQILFCYNKIRFYPPSGSKTVDIQEYKKLK